MLAAFVHGLILAFGLILPIGMQNSFILTQGALHRRLAGALPSVVTASLCDTLLTALAVLGVSAVALRITWLRYAFGVIGIVFLLYMGWSTWHRSADDTDHASVSTPWTARRQIGFACSVSLLNPHALMDTLTVIGGSATAYPTWSDKIAFGTACAVVSWLWFFGLAAIGHILGQAALKRASLRVINWISAVMMWASSAYLAYVIFSWP